MSSRARLVLLAALCAGALLVGVELMITAVALPSIVADLADWTQLRRASWIVNGYLLAYIAAMPLAGRLGDRYVGIPRLFMIALALFGVGSALSGMAPTLDALIGARIVQGLGAGAILPLATAGASHLYEGHLRARALGVVGAATFMGMALGPFLGATVLELYDLDAALIQAQVAPAIHEMFGASWRWVFYLGVPLSVVTLSWVWAVSPSWVLDRAPGRLDAVGAALWTGALAAGLVALTALGEAQPEGSLPLPLLAGALCVITAAAALVHASRIPEPFLGPRLFRNRMFSGAMLLSLLTGYALATAIVGAAVFVDRVRYAGTDEQRVVLGTLALSMAIGSLGSGFLLRRAGVVSLSLLGLTLSTAGLVTLGVGGPATDLPALLAGLALFGLGFGLTVTPRSAAAVEALGRRAFGMASAGVTVSRMAGMAVGLAVLTGFGTSRIEALSVVLVDPVARDAVLPPELRGRVLADPVVVGALETWASTQAGAILGGLFLVAAAVTLLGIVPTLLMRASTPGDGRATTPGDDPDDGVQPAFGL